MSLGSKVSTQVKQDTPATFVFSVNSRNSINKMFTDTFMLHMNSESV